MPTAHQLRAQIEATLAGKIPSALTPQPRVPCPTEPTGIGAIDLMLRGGLPVGALSELVGPECSGRTSLALTFVANLTQSGKVCAWIDVSDALHPESAAALGVDLTRLLWVRCGVPAAPVTAPWSTTTGGLRSAEKSRQAKPGPPPSAGSHPRMEAKGLSTAVSDLLGSAQAAPRGTETQSRPQRKRPAPHILRPQTNAPQPIKSVSYGKSWSRLEQALRVSDLLLQAGGFSCLVLDMGSLSAEHALRVPLATWFRFRAAADRLQSNMLLLSQHACTRNSAGLVLHLAPGRLLTADSTLFTGLEFRAELIRKRFPPAGNGFALRKPPQNAAHAQWQGKTVWAGRR